MNPFLWSGPSFLGFYFCLALAVVIWCYYQARFAGRRVRLSQADLTSDPYRIAYLRGGDEEAIRIAVFNLVDRGILEFDGTSISRPKRSSDEVLRRPLDIAIVEACKTPTSPLALVKAGRVTAVTAMYEGELVQRGLLPGKAEKVERLHRTWIALGILGGVAAIKIAVAIATGRWNFGILVFFAIIACIAAAIAVHPRVTAAGREALATMRTLVKRLESNAGRLKKGGATNEALLLAAVLGLYALPVDTYGFIQEMYPKPKPTSSDGSSNSDGSSCSSSCGGGGGCGGCGGG